MIKQILVALLAALSFNALAVDPTTVITPSPLGIVIAVRSYLKDQKKVYYIRVESQARDFEQAKKQVFRLASEQVAGTVVLSETELRNSNLTRDEIITYSSGLIDEYKIVDRFDGAGFVKLTMDVWIAESVMAQRLLAKSAHDQKINGDSLATRVNSIVDERNRGDAVIAAVMRDMPRRGFVVKLQPAQVSMSPDRTVTLSIRADVAWDSRYVDAFTAAAKETGNPPNPICWSNCVKTPYYLNGYVFEDPQKLQMVIGYVRAARPTLKVEIQDPNGQALSRICQPLPLLQEYTRAENPMIIVGAQHVMVGADNKFASNFNFYLGADTAKLARLDEIRAEVVTQSQCRAF
jgi:hypothetical protein